MTQAAAVVSNEVYGSFELKKLYPRNFSIGLITAVFFHLLAIGSYYFIQTVNKGDDFNSAPTVRILKYTELGPPPSITNDVPPQIAVAGPVARPTVGVPVPVPDKEVPIEQTIATQQQMNEVAGPSIGDGTGTGFQITKDIKIEPEKTEEPGINDFVPFEKYPEVVVAAQPDYPEIAKRAGITGKVFVKILIDKTGKPQKAVVIKSDSELFNEPSINAAMKTTFTPALQQNHPIMVWIVMPYRFILDGQK